MIRVHDTYENKKTFTQYDVMTFAKLTDDMNPFHIDKEFAAKNRFGRQIVQGVLISCAFSEIFFTKWPGDNDAFFISQEVLYNKPVFIDEDYTIKLECTDVDGKRAIGTIEGVMKDSKGDKIVQVKARIYCEKHFASPKLQ